MRWFAANCIIVQTNEEKHPIGKKKFADGRNNMGFEENIIMSLPKPKIITN